jgi:hypothetical protein
VLPPTLAELARQNAVEGQVGETIGALVATCQARAAAPELRGVFASIARDEARHAELAHQLARWLEPRLTASERTMVADARQSAITRRRPDVGCDLGERDRALLGIPPQAAFEAATAAMFAML